MRNDVLSSCVDPTMSGCVAISFAVDMTMLFLAVGFIAGALLGWLSTRGH